MGYLNHTQNKKIIICNKNRFLMFMTISMVMSTLKCSIIVYAGGEIMSGDEIGLCEHD